MSLDLDLPADAYMMEWEMTYAIQSGFDEMQQFIAIHLRDPATDEILTTLYKTAPGAPLSIPMTTFATDIQAYAGQSVTSAWFAEARRSSSDLAHRRPRYSRQSARMSFTSPTCPAGGFASSGS